MRRWTASRTSFFSRYGGYTIRGTVDGAYRMESGAKQVDQLLEVWVAVAPSDIEKLKQMVAKWCKRLGQETMWFERTGSAVEFIGPEDE